MGKEKAKIGIIDVGGGIRDVYAAGVLETCLRQGVQFDYCIGISAGSGNMMSYLAGQRERNIRFYEEYVFRKEYIGIWNFFKLRNYINLEYPYRVISGTNGENPVDYDAFEASAAEFYVVACNALTGETKYFDRSDIRRDCYDVVKASSSLPVVNQPYVIDGVPYYDGGLADPVPVQKAFADGCDKVVLVLSRPREYVRVPDRDIKLAKRIRKKYPKAAEEFCLRYKKYNDSVALAKEYEAKGRLLLVAPDDCLGVDTLTRDKTRIVQLYQKGLEDGKRIRAFVC